MHDFPGPGGYLKSGIIFQRKWNTWWRGAGQKARANPSPSHTLLSFCGGTVGGLATGRGRVTRGRMSVRRKLFCGGGFSFREGGERT